MLRLFFKYLNYKIFNGNRRGHGIHSPFVFSFIQQVLINTKEDAQLTRIHEWHKNLRKRNLPVGKVSFGAGTKCTRIFSSGRSDHAGRIGPSFKYGKLLYKLVRFSSPRQIIELGTGAGISLGYLAMADPDLEVISVEGCPERSAFAEENIKTLGLKNITLICSSFDDFLRDHPRIRKPFLIYIDGNHSYLPTLKYFKYFCSLADENSIIVIDDIHWSKEMEQAWEEIKTSPHVRISIDLFFTGILFFRKSIAKQDFIIDF